MSRLNEEYIMAVVRNRSGIDSGEIDYSIPVDKFDKQSIQSLEEIKTELARLIKKCEDRIREVVNCEHLWVIDEVWLYQHESLPTITKIHWQGPFLLGTSVLIQATIIVYLIRKTAVSLQTTTD